MQQHIGDGQIVIEYWLAVSIEHRRANLTKFAQTLKKGEHVYVSGDLRYREYEKAVGEGKNTVMMPVAEIHAAEIRRLDPRTPEDGAV
jgi:single-stranded DNA-binding protein